MEELSMKNLLKYSLVGVIIMVCFFFYMKEEKHREVIYTVEALTLQLNSANSKDIFIDLRDREDYRTKHIAGFINLPFHKENNDVKTYLEKKKYKNRKLYLMCYSGNRSGSVFNELEKAGYGDLVYIGFGFDEYSDENNDSNLFERGKCKCEEE